jgi:transaldolase
VDQRIAAIGSAHALALKGKTGVALAKCCHQRYQELFHGPDFAALTQAGVRRQTPLWASTGTKNPDYSDLLYVEPLIGKETINTLPDATLAAFRDHGRAEDSLGVGIAEAQLHLFALAGLGIDPGEIGDTLQVDGVRIFAEAYAKLLAAMV